MNGWYDCIEPGIRPAVKLLRDNGFNTSSSCEHKMYVECHYIPEGEVHRLHRLLFDAGFREYEISIRHTVAPAYTHSVLTVTFPVGGSK